MSLANSAEPGPLDTDQQFAMSQYPSPCLQGFGGKQLMIQTDCTDEAMRQESYNLTRPVWYQIT